ncbi:MAG: RNA methyltransferase [bacterium]|nr:RNA methyltransferase [bacterium]
MAIPKALKSRINALKLGIGDTRERFFLGEGLTVIREGINSGWFPRWLIVSEENVERYSSVIAQLSSKVEIYVVDKKEMKEISTLETPPGIIGIFPKREISLSDGNIFVIVDGLQDPGNLGTIIRTADAVGANGVVVLKGSIDPYNHKVVRGSMGSIFHIPVVKVEEVESFFNSIKDKYLIIGTSSYGEKLYYDVSWRFPLALIFGSEARGLSKEVERFCDTIVRIPIFGKAESLNVAVACGIILYEVVRKV